MNDHDERTSFAPWPHVDAALLTGDVARVVGWFDAEFAHGLESERACNWALLFIGLGDLTRAHQALSRVSNVEEGASALALLVAAEGAPEERGSDAEAGSDPFLDPSLPDPEDAAREGVLVSLFLRFFAGRRDLYARQWYDTKRKRGGYRPVREPLTDAVASAHLAGRLTIGQYLLWNDDSVSFAVVDLDLAPDTLALWRLKRGQEASPAQHPTVQRYARMLIEAGSRIGLPFFAEDSGGKGLHLWLFFESRLPAKAARSLLTHVALAAGPAPVDVRMELFPKQERAGERGLSSLVKLPLGVHQATLRPCPLLDEELTPIGDVRTALERLRYADAGVLGDVLGRRLVPLPATAGLPLDPAPDPVPQPSRVLHARNLGEVLHAVPPGRPTEEACDRMLTSCGVLRELARRAYDRHALLPDEARALVYTLGLVGAGKNAVDELLAVAGVSNKELARVRCGHQAPTGCKRLRALWKDAPACPCPEGPDALPYATPALFAVGAVAPTAPDWERFAPWVGGPEQLVDDPLRTLGALLSRLDERLNRLEERPSSDEDPNEGPSNPTG